MRILKLNNRVVLFLILFFSLGCNNQAFAYIDPGFGSMMLSLLLGIVTTLYFLFYSLIIFLKRKLKINLFKNNNNLAKVQYPFVIYSDGKEYHNVFRPIIEEFEKRQIPLLFYTSSKDDPFFEQNYKYAKGEYIGKNNEAYIKLAFLHADICLMSTPQLDVLQLKRSKFVKCYIHIFHGITTSMDYRLFSLDYYDSVLCDGEFQIPLIRELEQKRNTKKKDLIVIGSTYMDVLSEKLKNNETKKLDNYTILIAPSWGENSIFNKYPNAIDKLSKTDWNIIIRPHPRSLIVESGMIKKLREKYKNNKRISWDFENDNLKTMAQSDILITDYSTIMFDYAFLFNKPFLFMNQDFNKEILDISDISTPIWRYEIMDKIGYRITRDNINDIVSIVEHLKDSEVLEQIKDEIKKARDIAWFYQGESAKRAVDYMLLKQEELK